MSIESRSRQYGKVFDHWQIKEFLGSGSGGKTAVFRLTRTDSSWGESALKVVSLIAESEPMADCSRFRRQEYERACAECSRTAEREVQLMDELRGNTNIVDYLDHTFVDWSDETGFGRDLLIRMELLTDLRTEMRSERKFTEAEIQKIGMDICRALIRCHQKNILHRDVKPGNIFRNRDGDYKLGDFGVSRVLDACPDAAASTGIGTYEYWPAEQMTGSYDKRVDIYSLGLVLYELSNQNRLPFAAMTYITSRETALRLSGTPVPPPSDASPAFAQVILKACAFKPEDRFQDAAAFLRALEQLAVPAARLPQYTRSDPYATAPAFPGSGTNPRQPGSAQPAQEAPAKGNADGNAQRPSGTEKSRKKRRVLLAVLPILCAGAAAAFYFQSVRDTSTPQAAAAVVAAVQTTPIPTEPLPESTAEELEQRASAGESTAPTSEPAAPASEATVPTAEPTMPASEATVPTAEPTAPTSEPTAAPAREYPIGSEGSFGTYEQDNDRSNGAEAIEWIVLKQEDDRVMLISKYCLDCRPYHNALEAVDWERCSLRQWLNDEFFDTAFTPEEQLQILAVTNENPAHDLAKTSSGESTSDCVSILSREEAENLFASVTSRSTAPTAYARGKGAYFSTETRTGWWWLRTTSFLNDHVTYVTSLGGVSTEGREVIRQDAGVRPVIWISAQ